MSEEKAKRIIEVAGVKLEVDLREAKTIESYKVGDNVKVLIKEGYGDNRNFVTYLGVIVGFDQFKNLPTIIIAYLQKSYSGADLKFAYLNEESKEIEIVPSWGEDIIIEEEDIVSIFNNLIEEAQGKVKDLQRKKNYFVKYFNQYFKK